MWNKFLISLIWVFLPLIAFSQNISFYVLVAKGSIAINNSPLNQGDTITNNQEIKILDDSSYLCIISIDKKRVLEINKRGAYKLMNLLHQFNAIDNTYAQMAIIDLMDYIKKKESSRFKYIYRGRVYRTEEGFVRMILPDSEGPNKLYGNKISFKWEIRQPPYIIVNEPISKYRFYITNIEEELLFKKEMNQAMYTLSLTDDQFPSDNALLIKITGINRKNNDVEDISVRDDDVTIFRLAKEDKERIEIELGNILKNEFRGTAFSKLIEAYFFENNDLPIDALEAYKDALKLSSEASYYNKMYDFFLNRNGLIPQSQK